MLSVGSVVFMAVKYYIIIKIGIKQSKVVHDHLMKSLLYADLSSFFNRIPTGRIVNRLTLDLTAID